MRSFDRRFPMKYRLLATLLTAACVLPGPTFAKATAGRPPAKADTPRGMYNRALAQERQLRDDASKATAAQMHRVVASYESIVRKHPASGYCDNALWQGANLAALAYERFGNEADHKTAARLFAWLIKEYPSSRL